MTMAWTGERQPMGKTSNLSHRFRRAVIQGNLPLAKRLAATATSLSENAHKSASAAITSAEPVAADRTAGNTRRTSAAETVRRTTRVSNGGSGVVLALEEGEEGDDHARFVGGRRESNASSVRSMGSGPTRRAMLAAPGRTAAAGGEGTLVEEDNPATPTLRSHWANTSPNATSSVSASSTSNSVRADGPTASLPAPSRFRADSNSSFEETRPFPSEEFVLPSEMGPTPTSIPAQRNKLPDCPLLPPMIRYTRQDPTVRPYVTPSERATRAQRAALDVPFTIRNVDLTSPAGSEGRKSSLILALEHGTGVEMVEWLLEMGHEEDGPSTDNDNNSVFALAAIYNRCDVMERYSIHYVDVTSLIRSRSASEGRTALHWAALKGHDAAIKLLLSLGANVDAFDNDHTTPLHFASAWGHITSVQLLKEVGARSDLANIQGFRALDWAYDNNIKIVLENFDEQYRGSLHGHSHSSASDGFSASSLSTRSPAMASQHLVDLKSGGVGQSGGGGGGGGTGAELGNVRSIVMSRDQAAMLEYRRALPRQQHTGSDRRQQQSYGSIFSSPKRGSIPLRNEPRRSITLSPDTLRGGVLSLSPPTSPPVQLAHLR
ncbi:hypothetical protein A4X13_0g2549 [Tilletia indica]|uniref:Ankyrin n=1 Tax=Tilletia indica TaxID=43049 RepID=A0A8T8T6Y9_9BASI|nr:hypothetical protein A4X13_0g2549 [Tilletia indica]